MQARRPCLWFYILVLSSSMKNIDALPSCQDNDRSTWTNCVGQAAIPRDGLYFGEFFNGLYHGRGRFQAYGSWVVFVGHFAYGSPSGEGIEYSVLGTKIREGVWYGAQLLQAKPLDSRKYPANEWVFQQMLAEEKGNTRQVPTTGQGDASHYARRRNFCWVFLFRTACGARSRIRE